MLRVGPYEFKLAETEDEFAKIHRLNHKTFVEEIPQHQANDSGQLVDKFHHKNRYFIAVKAEQVVGMVCAHEEPPFSVESRLPDASVLQAPGMKVMEVRLLAIESNERHSHIFPGLIWSLYEYAVRNGNTHMVISGIAERQTLYERLGFKAMGPAVPSGDALFLPMIMKVGELPESLQRTKTLWEAHLNKVEKKSQSKKNGVLFSKPNQRMDQAHLSFDVAIAGARVCLLPGPVSLSQQVRHAFEQPLHYHRSPEFIKRFVGLRQLLAELVGINGQVVLFNGSGTLANETVAVTLANIECPGTGVLLINGEFGHRLAKQASRFGLAPHLMTWDWGQPWDLEEIEDVLSEQPEGSWIWGVHQESSTGVLNDLPGLVEVAKKFGIRVCADCVSSIGAVPLELQDVFLATGSSGKSLGSVAGAAIIFANESVPNLINRDRVPSYMDLVAALENEGPCYTFPSSTLFALEAALQNYATPEKAEATYRSYDKLGQHVRQQLKELDLTPIAPEDHVSPVISTFAPPGEETSLSFVERCLSWGIAIGGHSKYLAERRLIQIATMGAVSLEMVDYFFEQLKQWLAREMPVALGQNG